MQPNQTITSFEKWFNKKPESKHLRVFGTEAYFNITKEKRKKFDAKSQKVTFVGYDNESCNYRLWDDAINKVHISSDVDFNENGEKSYTDSDNTAKIKLDFGEETNEAIEDQDNNTEEGQQVLQQVAENSVAGQERQLRNRALLRCPDRYGVPVALIAEAIPTTYEDAMRGPDAEKWSNTMIEEIKAIEESDKCVFVGVICNSVVYFGIVFENSGSMLNVNGFTDADYAGCTETRKSRSGFVFLLNGGPISWSSQRQSIVSLSTAEAEYIALTHGAKEAIWLRQFLNDLGLSCKTVPILVDNQSAIRLASNSEFHKRSKHIDVRFHFVRDVIDRKEIEIDYVQSKNQLADIFTKPIAKQQFCFLRDNLNVRDHLK